MTRTVIYARYSSDNQKPTSIEDQIRICEERAKREGWAVVEIYTDYEMTGAFMHNRTGVKSLMRDGAAGHFDLVVTEALDRLSRDQEDIAGLYKRLQFNQVRIFTLSEGEITPLHIGMKGTMNALFLKDLADKVRRGQRGRVENGKIGGGNGYGYNVIKRFDEAGEPVRGERSINEAQSAIVRRIFDEFVAGKSPKAIARQLNLEGVQGPGGKGWAASTINGNWQRGSGILNNEMYAGVIAWNKVRYVKHPDTGRNVTRPNPESEWVRKKVPEFRIVSEEIWQSAKARQRRSRLGQRPFWEKQRPKYLFSHLLKCGCCGGGVCKISTTRYGCATIQNKGEALCSNRRTIKQSDLEHTVLKVLRDNLMDPSLVEVFCKEYTAHMNRLRIEHNAQLHSYNAELEKLERAERRIVRAVVDGYDNETMKRQSHEIAARRKVLSKLLEGTKEVPVLLHPTMASRYRQAITTLVRALDDENDRAEAIEIIRSLVEKIVLSPNPQGLGLIIDVHGDLAGILNIATRKEIALPNQEMDMKQIRMVVGLEDSAMIHQRGNKRSRRSEVSQAAVAGSGATLTEAASIGALDKVVGPEATRLDFPGDKKSASGVLAKMVGPEGLEPPTKRL